MVTDEPIGGGGRRSPGRGGGGVLVDVCTI